MKLIAKSLVLVIGLVIVLVIAGLLTSPIKPVGYTPDPVAPLADAYAPNTLLSNAEQVVLGPGPEDVVAGPDGRLYAGLIDGRIVSFTNPNDARLFADTGGRPLGLAFAANGTLLVADAGRGLIAVEPDGSIEILVDSFDDERMLFVDDLDIDANGVVWFSDASRRFGVHDYMYDFMEASSTGRLFRYDPKTRETTLAMDNLFFANGVALGPDDRFVLVNETGSGRIHRLWLKGDKKGERDLFAQGLPGNPDNLSFNGSDTFWVAMPAVRGSAVEALANKPLLRKLLAALPSAWLVPPERRAFVIGLSLDGEPIANLQWPDGELHTITSVNQFGNRLYLGSIETDRIGIYELDIATP